jgi:hypothetical protein
MVRLHGNKFAVYAKEPTRGSSALKKLRRSLTAEGREGRRRRWESTFQGSHSIHSDTRPVKKCGQPIFFCEISPSLCFLLANSGMELWNAISSGILRPRDGWMVCHSPIIHASSLLPERLRE